MKLSLDKRSRGGVHVRGGRFRRVLLPHAVPASGQLEGKGCVVRDKDYETAKPGDLVIEVYGVKAKRVLGYSYLSGAALQMVHYEAKPEWFGPADVVRLELQTPGTVEGESAEETVARMVGNFTRVKYEHDVGICEFRLSPRDGNPDAVVSSISAMLQYRAVPQEEHLLPEQKGHIFCVIRTPRKKDNNHTLHMQPKCDVSDDAATVFQILMAVGSDDGNGGPQLIPPPPFADRVSSEP